MERPDRAYVHISAGTTRIGNAWIERSWSAFLGHTVGLTDRTHPRDWIAGPGGDFLLSGGERRMTPMDLGEKEWSEALFSQGAALTARHAGPGIAFDVCTRVFHRASFMMRSCRLMNASGCALQVDEAVLDQVHLAASAPECATFALDCGGMGGYCLDRGRGLVVAALPGAAIVFDDHKQATAIRCVARAVAIAPGAYKELPDIGMAFFSGAAADAATAAETIAEQILKWRIQEEEQRALARAEGDACDDG